MIGTIRLAFGFALLLWPAVSGAAAAPVEPSAPSPATSSPPASGPVVPNPMVAVRADRWADAATAAAQYADPVAAKLVTYYRMLAPGAATEQEIANFVASSLDWPAQALLERRRQEAIGADPDDASVLAQCDQGKITLPSARIRCADALANAGHNAEAVIEARQAWVTGYPDGADFPQRWRADLTLDDQWDRFQALASTDAKDAARQIPLLDPSHRALAEARLALQHDAPDATAKLAAVPAARADDPGLMLDQARWLRRAERIPDAFAVWRTRGAAAEQAASPSQLPAYWAERQLLARRLLHDGQAADAYTLVDDPGPILPRQKLDADFLAGFIALRLLHQPQAAMRHFQALAAASPAAITQARAWYWLSRAASGQEARADAEKAAAWPTTFYGQLAALSLGDDTTALAGRINALHDPPSTRDQAFGLTQREVVRAAALLVAWGEPRRATTFLLRMDELAPDLADRALTAQLATALGQPYTAVAIARRIGRDGAMLPQAGWPTPVAPPADMLDPAVVLGLIRQESDFDATTTSPTGARGLMQLMPRTAATVARQIGTTVTPVALIFDPQQNMRLGTAYLQELLTQYDNALPLALAAYNAGPSRVGQWLADNGDPRVGPIDMVDWIELIPFGETRDYVQRVLENVVIYRARSGQTTPTLLAQWTR